MVYAQQASQRLTTMQYKLWQRLIYLSNRGFPLPEDFQDFIRPRHQEANTMEKFYNLLAIWAGNQKNPEAILASLAQMG
jgi:hypothetical protein